MSNILQDYKDNYRANLPAGVTYDPVTADYFYNNKRFQTIQQVEWYRRYLFATEGFTSVVADLYSVAGLSPSLVFDFDDEYYRTGGSTTTFEEAMTHTRSGNATMVDSDGVLKWAPHNLLTYSEQFDNVAWTKNGLSPINETSTTAPDGTLTANELVETATSDWHRMLGPFTAESGTTYTATIYAKASSGGRYLQYINSLSAFPSGYANFDIDNGEVATTSGVTATIEELPNAWYRCSVTQTANATSSANVVWLLQPGDAARNDQYVGNGTSGIYLWGAHLYRSDLGGMVANPDQPTGFETYVPTTSAARYLPRRGHHIYNGAEWVNEGVLVESEQRVNLVTYSNNFSAGNWAIRGTDSVTVVSGQSNGPDGASSLSSVLITDTTLEDKGVVIIDTLLVNTAYTFSVFVKNIDQRYVSLWLRGVTDHWAATVFDLELGAVTDEQTGTLSGTIISNSIENFGGGIYRISMTASVGSVGGTEQFGMLFNSSATPTLSNEGIESYVGVAGVGIYAGFAQLEAASTPSSYIPTSGSTATRSADVITVPSANLPYNSTNMSIQMDGTASYALNSGNPTVQFLRWYKDSANWISDEIDTNATSTINQFIQLSGGVVDLVQSVTVGGSGINVPFNIASRHGSTFINGAVDGTALTANTTPTALPDLSSTDLNLGFDYMGTIRTFRIWSDDLGDSGTATASATAPVITGIPTIGVS